MKRVLIAVVVFAPALFLACASTRNAGVSKSSPRGTLPLAGNVRIYNTDYDTTFRAAVDTLRRLEESSAKLVKYGEGIIIFKRPNDAGTTTVNVEGVDMGTTRVTITVEDPKKNRLGDGRADSQRLFFEEMDKLLGGAHATGETDAEEDATKGADTATEPAQSMPTEDPIRRKVVQALRLDEGEEGFLSRLSHEDLVLLEKKLESLAADSTEKLGRQCAACYIDLARLYHDDKLYNRSADALKIAISMDPTSAVAHCNLGEIYKHLGRYDEAIGELKTAERLDPELADTYINLGIIYDDYLNDDKEALENYGKYLNLGGENKQVLEWMTRIKDGS